MIPESLETLLKTTPPQKVVIDGLEVVTLVFVGLDPRRLEEIQQEVKRITANPSLCHAIEKIDGCESVSLVLFDGQDYSTLSGQIGSPQSQPIAANSNAISQDDVRTLFPSKIIIYEDKSVAISVNDEYSEQEQRENLNAFCDWLTPQLTLGRGRE